jgi:primosomal protein N'
LASSAVDVIVEIVGRPGPYRYRWPDKLGAPTLGDEVIVELQTRQIAAWVVAISSLDDDEPVELKGVLRLRRPSVSERLVQLALASARWYVCSPVYFLRKLRSPRVRDAAKVRAAQGSQFDTVTEASHTTQLAVSAPTTASHSQRSREADEPSVTVGIQALRVPQVGNEVTAIVPPDPETVERGVGVPNHVSQGPRSHPQLVAKPTAKADEEPHRGPDETAQGANAVSMTPVLAPMDLIWHSLGASSIEMALVFLRQRKGGRGIIICPTLRQRARMLEALKVEGLMAGDGDADWVEIALGAIDVVVAGRYGAFTPIENIDFVVVLDPIDPSMREQAMPVGDGLELARLRAGLEGIAVTVITAAPPLAVVEQARVYREPFALEAKRWPQFGVIRLAEVDPTRGVVGAILDRSRGVGDGRPIRLAIIVPSTGWSGWLRCQSCHALQRCPTCHGSLVPHNLDIERAGLSQRLSLIHRGLVVAAMSCASCSTRLPLRCLVCSSRKVTTAALSAERVRALVAGATQEQVELVTGEQMPAAESRYVVGGYGLLDRLDGCDVVALVNLEQFWGASSLEGVPLTLYYCNRAASIATRVLVCSDGSIEGLLTGLESRNLRPLYGSELASRQRLGLPPAKAIARITGVDAAKYLDAQAPEILAGLEVIAEGETSYLVVGPSSVELHERLGKGRWPTDSRSCRLVFDPLQL